MKRHWKISLALLLWTGAFLLWQSPLDESLLALIAQVRTEGLTTFFTTFTHLGSWRLLVPLGVLILLVAKEKDYRYPLSFGLLGAYAFNAGLKYLFGRERPNLSPLVAEGYFSFPSGHTMVNAVFMYYVYRYVFKGSKKWALPLLAYSLLMSFSRLYLGVHYPADVLAGYAAALTFLWGVEGFLSKRSLQS